MLLLSRTRFEKKFCGVVALSMCTVAGPVFAGGVVSLPTVSTKADVSVGASSVSTGARISAPPVAAGVRARAAVPPGARAMPHGAYSDRLDRNTLTRRAIGIGLGGVVAAYGAEQVAGAAKGLVSLGKVKNVPHWGGAVASIPIFGKMAKGGHVIPTTLGQVPVMGYVVKRVPVVGPIIAGPANPIVVGAVAIDTYVIPKYSPCGYTKSSIVAATNDFNNSPKLRSYVNYLAPMPYTHPPIYGPSTMETDLDAETAYLDGIPEHVLTNKVELPGL